MPSLKCLFTCTYNLRTRVHLPSSPSSPPLPSFPPLLSLLTPPPPSSPPPHHQSISLRHCGISDNPEKYFLAEVVDSAREDERELNPSEFPYDIQHAGYGLLKLYIRHKVCCHGCVVIVMRVCCHEVIPRQICTMMCRILQ